MKKNECYDFEIVDIENLRDENNEVDVDKKITDSKERLKETEVTFNEIIQKINEGCTVSEDHKVSFAAVGLIKKYLEQKGEKKLTGFSKMVNEHFGMLQELHIDDVVEKKIEKINNLIHQFGELFAVILRDFAQKTSHDKNVNLDLKCPLIALISSDDSFIGKDDIDLQDHTTDIYDSNSKTVKDSDTEKKDEKNRKNAREKKESFDKAEHSNEKSANISININGKCADVLFVLDASGSMRPCFEKLCDNISKFVEPFKEKGFESLRLGLLAYSAIKNRSGEPKYKYLYRNNFLCPDNKRNMVYLYGDESVSGSKFFIEATTENGIKSFCDRLKQIKCRGDEDTAFALDCAGDFPFKPLNKARRSIILFTDEPMDDGVAKMESLGENCEILKQVVSKIVDRHISLYYFGPQCKGVDCISEYSRVIVRNIEYTNKDFEKSGIWDSLDFSDILDKLGQTISSSALLTGGEPAFQKAVYGQDKWVEDIWWLL